MVNDPFRDDKNITYRTYSHCVFFPARKLLNNQRVDSGQGLCHGLKPRILFYHDSLGIQTLVTIGHHPDVSTKMSAIFVIH